MHQRRLIKQTAYAGGCLTFVFLALVVLVIVLFPDNTSRPTPPVPTPEFQAIVVEQVDVIPHGSTADLVARLRNPNPRAGIRDLPVDFILTDSAGTELARHSEMSYILPGSIQYVIALNVPLPAGFTGATASLPPEPVLTSLPPELTLPTFTTFLRQQTTRTLGDATIDEQRGVVVNDSTFDFHRVEVAVVALNGGGHVVGTGKTLLGTLTVGEQREFVVQWPSADQPITRVLILATTNIFREDNVIEIIGDPSRLR